MQTKLQITKKIASLHEARVGGKSSLPKEVSLPKTTLKEEGVINKAPTLLFTIPINQLKNLNYLDKYKDYYCSVFFDCDMENHEYISIMQDFYKDDYIATIVIIHPQEVNDRDDACFEPAYLMNIANMDKEEPEWIQDEIIWNGYRYICELDTLEIDKLDLSINLTFDSAKGYLFIKDDWTPNQNCGAFLLQTS